MATGGFTSYALLSNGTVRAWGGDKAQQLGDGKLEREFVGSPVAVVEQLPGATPHELTGATAVAAGYGAETNALAIVGPEHEVVTSGAAEYGERGNGEHGFEKCSPTSTECAQKEAEERKEPYTPRNVATPAPGLKHVVGIATGGTSDFALEEVGGRTNLKAWGGDYAGKLGTNGESDIPARCHGLGIGKTKTRPCSTTPQTVHLELAAGINVIEVAAGRQAAYALLSDGTIMAWGRNQYGQLGNGTTVDSHVPVHVCEVGWPGPGECSSGHFWTGVSAISGGDFHALAIRGAAKEVVGWGLNGTGQVGGTSSGPQSAPKTVAGLESGVEAISAGARFSLALKAKTLYAFGRNDPRSGLLGNGNPEGPEPCGPTTCSRTPLPIGGLPPIEPSPRRDRQVISAGDADVLAPTQTEPEEGHEEAPKEPADSIDQAHSLAILSSASGPPAAVGVTPEAQSLVLTWRFGLTGPSPRYYQYRAFGLDAEGNENGEKTTLVRQSTPECSTASACSVTLKELTTGKPLQEGQVYKVIVESCVKTPEKECVVEQSRVKKAVPSALPTVTGVSPNKGPETGGTPISITGTNFVSGSTTLKFGSAEAGKVEVSSKKTLTAVTPPGSGCVDVTVSTAGGTSLTSAIDRYCYLPSPPVNTSPPVIQPATPHVNRAETAEPGSWEHAPTSYHYQWWSCPRKKPCEPVGTNSNTYTPQLSDTKHTLVAEVTASNAGGPSQPARSAPTHPVRRK